MVISLGAVMEKRFLDAISTRCREHQQLTIPCALFNWNTAISRAFVSVLELEIIMPSLE